jgi:FKBP-type peptidyl-prolyl cis-trans isomerase 2
VSNGQILGIKYTGYLASNGAIFDATSRHGDVPFSFRLDDDFADNQPFLANDQQGRFLAVDTSVIAGWEYGLQGIKVGEKRTLVISVNAGYGTSGNQDGSVPPNSVLVFDVQCVSLVTKPQLQVDSTNANQTLILSPGQKTIHAEDNTLYTLSNASSSSQTFQLVTYGSDDATGAPVSSWSFRGRGITVSGDKKEFGVSFNSGVLTVTFHPVKTGKRNATIHILTTDPLHPSFTFAVQGQSTAEVDLVDGFTRLHLPKAVVTSGTSQLITLPLVVENIGNSAVPAHSQTNVQVYAVDSAGDKTLVAFKNNINLSGLGVDKLSHQTMTFPLPASLASGAYTFLAEVNQGTTESNATISVPANGTLATFAEIASANDSATTPAGVSVVQGVHALTGTLGASTLAHSASGVTGRMVVTIQNVGTLPLPKDQTATATIVAHPAGTVGTTGDVALASALPVSLSLLGVRGVRAFPLSVDFAGSIPSGLYDLEVTLTTTLPGAATATTVSVDASAQGNPVLLTV